MIICCGEALIDMLPRQLEDGSDVYLPVAGGAIFNTAIALGRLGEDAGFVSGISTDLFGDQLIEVLQESKVKTDFVARSPNPTTLAFVKLVDGHAQYSFMDERSSNRELRFEAVPNLPENLAALHFGAISLIPEPCGSTYESLMAQYHLRTVISLDPNIRQSFIDDPDRHRARIQSMIAMSDIVKVSDEDLDWITDGADAGNAIRNWLSNGASVVLLTRGSEGVEIITSDFSSKVPAVPAKVVDTVGAGDTFNAGFLSGLREQGLLDKDALRGASSDQLKSAAELGAKVASFTVAQAGAVPPWRSELS